MSDLTILTVAENTGELLDLMMTSVFKYTHPAPKVIICNNGKTDTYIAKWAKEDGVMVIDNNPGISGGSNRHGDGLQKIFKLADTRRVAILDSDTVLLSEKWHEFDSKKYNLIGVERGTESGSVGRSYYHMCFMIINTDYFKGIDFRPGTIKTRSAGRSYAFYEDVGWAIKGKVVENTIKQLKFLNLKTHDGKVFDNSFCSVEIHSDDTAVAAHFGRGSNIRGKIDRKGFDTSKKQAERWISVARDHMR